MKITNHSYYDFLGFSPDEDIPTSGNRLWSATKPSKGEVAGDGSIRIEVPFACHKRGHDISVESEVPPSLRRYSLSAYGENTLRFYSGDIQKESRMLMDCLEEIKQPLYLDQKDHRWNIRDAESKDRGIIHFESGDIHHWSDLLPPPQEALSITFIPDGIRTLKLQDYDQFFPSRREAFSLSYITDDKGEIVQTYLSFKAAHNEHFVGTGERFANMDLSGQTFWLKNQDAQGTNNKRAYKNVPFYISSKGYGLFVHTSRALKISMADHSSQSVQLLIDGDELDIFMIGGSTPSEILYSYRMLSGFPSVPPLWSLGVWMSRMTYFSESEVMEICDRLRDEDYPCDVIHLDTGWFRTDWLCEWKFHPKRFPDPKGFIKKLQDKGYRVSLWQMPYIAEEAIQHEEARENNYICKRGTSLAQGGSNFSALDYAGTIDFTSEKAKRWYQGLLRELLEMGVACIKTDFGEEIHMDASYENEVAEKLANLYCLHYQEAAYEVTKEVSGDGIIWARAGWAGCQRFPIHWGGDAAATWEGMAGSLKGGLHLGLSGYGFWSHDVPGFHGVPNFMNSVIPSDLYLRWTQFGVFTSHIRYHGTSRREPYYFPEVSEMVRKWWHLRYALLPYLWEAGNQTMRSGMPVLRAMLLHYPDDPTCWHIDDQYFLGEDFLVAPIFNSQSRRDVYIPEGSWVHFFSGTSITGPRWLKGHWEELSDMPVWVQKGTSLMMNPKKIAHTGELDTEKYEHLAIKDGFEGIWRWMDQRQFADGHG